MSELYRQASIIPVDIDPYDEVQVVSAVLKDYFAMKKDERAAVERRQII